MLLWLFGKVKESSIKTTVNGGNGAISPLTTATGGDTVYFNVIPEEGYEFDFDHMIKKPADLVVTEVSANRYKFTMPNEPVELTGSFKKIEKYAINIVGGKAWDMAYNQITQATAGAVIDITVFQEDAATFDH